MVHHGDERKEECGASTQQKYGTKDAGAQPRQVVTGKGGRYMEASYLQ
jgi:hypothetical protein